MGKAAGKAARRECAGTPPVERGRAPSSASRSPSSAMGSGDKRKSPAAADKQPRRVLRPASGSPQPATGSGHKRQRLSASGPGHQRKPPAAGGLRNSQTARRTKSGSDSAAVAASPRSLERCARSGALVSFAEHNTQLAHSPESPRGRGGCASSDTTPTSLRKKPARRTDKAASASASDSVSPPDVRRRLSRLDDRDSDSVSSDPSAHVLRE